MKGGSEGKTNNIPKVTKKTFGVFKFLFGVIENTFGVNLKLESWCNTGTLSWRAFMNLCSLDFPDMFIRVENLCS